MDWKRSVLARTIAFAAVTLGMLLFAGLASAQSNGEKVYKAKCAACHGATGDASTPTAKAMKARDFCSDEVKKETDADFTDIINKGKNRMPAFNGKISDADIKDVIGYIRGLCKK